MHNREMQTLVQVAVNAVISAVLKRLPLVVTAIGEGITLVNAIKRLGGLLS